MVKPFFLLVSRLRLGSIRSADVAVILLAAFALSPGCSSKDAKKFIAFGHVGPLSGPNKYLGEHARQGILLAVEQANREDRLIKGERVEFLHADSQGDSGLGQAQISRLVTVNHVQGLFTQFMPGDPVVEAEDPPEIVWNPLNRPLKPSTLSISLAPERQGRLLAEFIQGPEIKARSIALIRDSRQELAGVIADALSRAAAKNGVLNQWTFEKSETIAGLADSVAQRKPDAVVLACALGDVSTAKTALEKVGVKAPIFFAGPEDVLPALTAGASTPENIYFATSYVPGEEVGEEAKAFAEKYREKYHAPPDLIAVHAYEAAGMLCDAYRRSVKGEASTPREALAALESYSGVTGTLVIKNHFLFRPAFIARIQAGQAKVVTRFTAEN